jgi:hypothetical protein
MAAKKHIFANILDYDRNTTLIFVALPMFSGLSNPIRAILTILNNLVSGFSLKISKWPPKYTKRPLKYQYIANISVF